jgi:unsaturated chondroitin disaccharide hydrolase
VAEQMGFGPVLEFSLARIGRHHRDMGDQFPTVGDGNRYVDSLWARGQGWAIFGFAVAAEWCQEEGFLETAREAARRFAAELPADGVPTWDLRLPDNAPHYRDSSASAIAAAGMLRLARLGGEGRGGEFYELAVMLLDALVANCFETTPEGQGLLRDGTYHAHKGWGVEAYFICGDYFFLEALLALAERAPDFWGPGIEGR